MKFSIKFLLILISFSIIGSTQAQTEDVTLIFKRPFPNIMGDVYSAKIRVNNKDVCDIDSTPGGSISACVTKISSGEVRIQTSSLRGDDYEFIFDSTPNKIYTIVVYGVFLQPWDLVWTEIGDKLVINKVPESEKYDGHTFKVRVISIK